MLTFEIDRRPFYCILMILGRNEALYGRQSNVKHFIVQHISIKLVFLAITGYHEFIKDQIIKDNKLVSFNNSIFLLDLQLSCKSKVL